MQTRLLRVSTRSAGLGRSSDISGERRVTETRANVQKLIQWESTDMLTNNTDRRSLHVQPQAGSSRMYIIKQ